MVTAAPYLFVGVRGALVMAPWTRAQSEHSEFDEDAFSLIARRSQMLGLAEFSADPHAIEHWGHADAGGMWTGDGDEELLAWLQMDVRTAARHCELPAGDHTRLLPIQSSFAVLEQALARVGSVEFAGADAIVPLAFMSDAASPLAAGRDWLQLGSSAATRRIAVHIDAAPSPNSLDTTGLIECMTAIGGEVLGPLDLRPHEPGGCPPASRVAQLFGRPFPASAALLACETHRWSVDFAAWTIELVAHACRQLGLSGDLSIAVRRAGTS